MAIRAPSFARRSAMPSPIPRLPPVTTATRFLSDILLPAKPASISDSVALLYSISSEARRSVPGFCAIFLHGSPTAVRVVSARGAFPEVETFQGTNLPNVSWWIANAGWAVKHCHVVLRLNHPGGRLVWLVILGTIICRRAASFGSGQLESEDQS